MGCQCLQKHNRNYMEITKVTDNDTKQNSRPSWLCEIKRQIVYDGPLEVIRYALMHD